MILPSPLRGITTPLATPLHDSGTLDTAGLDRLLRHVIDGGVNAIFILGTTGEGPSLSSATRRQVITQACQAANGTVPILVGITDTSTDEAVLLAEFAAPQNASGLVYAGPSYFSVGQSELFDHTARLADRVPLPLFLYNMPSHTRVTFEPETIRQATSIPKIIGFKDSSASLLYFQRVIQVAAHRKDFSILMGPEELLLSAMLCGAHGGVNGGSNIFPQLYVALYQAAASGNTADAQALQQQVLEISAGIYNAGTYSSSYLKGLKTALHLLGICEPYLAEPYHGLEQADRDRIAANLEKLNARYFLSPVTISRVT